MKLLKLMFQQLNPSEGPLISTQKFEINLLTCASITKTRAPQPPKIVSESNVESIKSIWPGKSQIWNCTKLELLISSFTILFVLSKNRVSFGDILWKTTFCIDDFPDLENVNLLENIVATYNTIMYNSMKTYSLKSIMEEIVEIVHLCIFMSACRLD